MTFSDSNSIMKSTNKKIKGVIMPIIYYTYYTPVSNSIPTICDQEHDLGRKLLRNGLKRFYDIQLTSSELLSCIKIDQNGKPYLKDYPEIHFNISHCNELVVCVFHNASIGVDAELPGPFVKVLINKVLSEEEKKALQNKGITPQLEQEWFYRFWTLKEAYVKNSGTGLDVILTDFSFSFIEKKGIPIDRKSVV